LHDCVLYQLLKKAVEKGKVVRWEWLLEGK
jgi:hypothetical protein